MSLDFLLLLAPLLPCFHFPGSACHAPSLGASHHWVLGHTLPHWAAWASSPGHHPLLLPTTSHPILAPGFWLWSLFTCRPSLLPTATLLSQRSLSSPCIPPDPPLTSNAGSSHVSADGPLLQHCPPAAPWNAEPSKGSALAQPHPTDLAPKHLSGSAGPCWRPPGLRRGATLPMARGSPTLLQCSVSSKTQLIVHMIFLKMMRSK